MDEKVIETRTCRQCSIKFSITDQDMEFYTKVSPVFGGKKELVPPPTLCPECRQRRRLAFRNERNLYRRKCDLTGRDIISMYSPDKTAPVYDFHEWYGDKWQATDYGVDFDFSRTFHDQIIELSRKVPNLSRSAHVNNVNSDYINSGGGLKNCYLVFDCNTLEDCLYVTKTKKSQMCLDTLDTLSCEHCYECITCDGCFDVSFSLYCSGCRVSAFLRNCYNCQNCLLCVNLSNREYCIKNVQYSKEAYEASVQKYREELLKNRNEVTKFWSQYPHPHLHIIMGEGCSGDSIVSSKNCQNSFNVRTSEDLTYCVDLFDTMDSMDISTFGGNLRLSYEGVSVGLNVERALFCSGAIENDFDVIYSFHCRNSSYLFGCVGILNKSYCILNKQYTKEAYEALVPRIIAHMRSTGEWGEFFNPDVSLFGYNETVAQEYFPMTKEEALKQGFNWSDYEAPFPQATKTLPAHLLPARIEDIPDDILNWAIICEVTGKPFRIVKAELEFYRKHKLPIPHRHPDQRHLDRMALRNPRKLFERTCDKCQENMQTTYTPERPEKVYCEQCYNKEVYG